MEATTPTVKLCYKSYFSGILEARKGNPKIGERNNLKIRIEGEVITSDEFVELLEEQKTTKQSKKKVQKRQPRFLNSQPQVYSLVKLIAASLII